MSCMNQMFSGGFRCRIRAVWGKRRTLRKELVFPARAHYFVRRNLYKAIDPGGARRIKQDLCAHYVCLYEIGSAFDGTINVRFGGEVDDHIGTFDCLVNRCTVANV